MELLHIVRAEHRNKIASYPVSTISGRLEQNEEGQGLR